MPLMLVKTAMAKRMTAGRMARAMEAGAFSKKDIKRLAASKPKKGALRVAALNAPRLNAMSADAMERYSTMLFKKLRKKNK